MWVVAKLSVLAGCEIDDIEAVFGPFDKEADAEAFAVKRNDAADALATVTATKTAIGLEIELNEQVYKVLSLSTPSPSVTQRRTQR